MVLCPALPPTPPTSGPRRALRLLHALHKTERMNYQKIKVFPPNSSFLSHLQEKTASGSTAMGMSRRSPCPGPTAPSQAVGHTVPPPTRPSLVALQEVFPQLCLLLACCSPGMTRFVILSHPHCGCSAAGPAVSITNAPVSSLHTT